MPIKYLSGHTSTSQWGKQSANHMMKFPLERCSTSRKVGKRPLRAGLESRSLDARIWGWMQGTGAGEVGERPVPPAPPTMPDNCCLP